jgi:ribosomal protein L28
MSSVCDICGKTPQFGKQVSHSHIRTNRRFNPNIQRVRAVVDGTNKHINACTKCIKSERVVRPAGV